MSNKTLVHALKNKLTPYWTLVDLVISRKKFIKRAGEKEWLRLLDNCGAKCDSSRDTISRILREL